MTFCSTCPANPWPCENSTIHSLHPSPSPCFQAANFCWRRSWNWLHNKARTASLIEAPRAGRQYFHTLSGTVPNPPPLLRSLAPLSPQPLSGGSSYGYQCQNTGHLTRAPSILPSLSCPSLFLCIFAYACSSPTPQPHGNQGCLFHSWPWQ